MTMYSPDVQLDYVTKRMIDYFSQVTQIAKDYSPPGKNAANGWLRTRMVDGHMANFGNAPTLDLDGDAAIIFSAYKSFFTKCQASFLDRENYAVPFADQVKIVWEKLVDRLLDDIGKIFKDILSITTFDLTKIAVLVDDIKKYLDDINAKGMLVGGRQLNGWIGPDIRNASLAVAPTLEGIKSERALKVAAILKESLEKLAALSKGSPEADGSKPWALPQWQTSYMAVTSAAAIAFQSTLSPA